MDGKWKVKVYETLSGDKPIEQFIRSLDEKTQLKIAITLDFLE